MVWWKILLWVACGLAAGYLAHKRGKNPILWFFIGTLLGLIGVFFLFFMPKPKQEPITLEVKTQPASLFWYYLSSENVQRGPFNFESLKQAWHEGKITSQTYVWNQTLPQWLPFSQFIK